MSEPLTQGERLVLVEAGQREIKAILKEEVLPQLKIVRDTQLADKAVATFRAKILVALGILAGIGGSVAAIWVSFH